MSFIHDKIATITFVGDYFTLTTEVDSPSEVLDQETEPAIVEAALEFLKAYYGWDLAKSWTDYSIRLRDAE